jgi:hypothetical protein
MSTDLNITEDVQDKVTTEAHTSYDGDDMQHRVI